MGKVKFFDKKLVNKFKEKITNISVIFSLILIFIDRPDEFVIRCFLAIMFVLFLSAWYVFMWYKANKLLSIDLDIESSAVTIKVGDIFKEEGLKAIAFNEYFDTLVNDVIISKKSLNGIFINNYLNESVSYLDEFIKKSDFDENEVLDVNKKRKEGKGQRYKIGTICVYNSEYILTAFTRFDDKNKAYLTMPDYLGFLIKFWDKVNNIYSQRSVVVPIFGSGITRIKEHKNISDEELLKIMLWTFRISEMRFEYPAKLTIVISKNKINKINLFDISSAKNGL